MKDILIQVENDQLIVDLDKGTLEMIKIEPNKSEEIQLPKNVVERTLIR